MSFSTRGGRLIAAAAVAVAGALLGTGFASAATAAPAASGAPAAQAVQTGQAAIGSRPSAHVMRKTPQGLASLAVPAGTHLTYYGGPVIANAKVQGVFWGAGTYGPNAGPGGSMPAFFDAIGSSAYFDWLTEYNTPSGTAQTVGHASSAGEATITPSLANNGATIDDANMRTELVNQLTAGTLPAPELDATGHVNTLYALYFPAGKTLTQGGLTGGVDWCAYHGTAVFQGRLVPYMVLPAFTAGSSYTLGCGSNPTTFNNFTSVASHELVEAVTDPGIGLATSAGPPLGWYDLTNGEIGDICNAQQGTIAGYTVQKQFSNTTGTCIVTRPLPTSDLFTSVSPVRIIDSRPSSQVGPYNSAWGPTTTRNVSIIGVAGVPAGADAVALNVTVTDTTGYSHLDLWPAGQAKPSASNLNWAPGWTIPNAVTVMLGTSGQVSVYNNAGSANVVIDVVGYYKTGVGAGFTSLTPVRITDSRPSSQVGPYASPWAPGQTRDVSVAGPGSTAGVPADADAVVVNATVTDTTGYSNLVVWPKGQTKPVASSLNWSPGWTVPNAVTVKVGSNGQVSLYNNSGSVNVIIDVVGYFEPGTGAAFHPLSPVRITDSRPSSQVGPYASPWGGGVTRSIGVATGGVPTSAVGVLMNVTVTDTTGNSHLDLWPAGHVKPSSSSLNWAPGWTIPNSVTAKVGTNNQVNVYNNTGSTNVIVDTAGYYG